jgi:hypothetical protein
MSKEVRSASQDVKGCRQWLDQARHGAFDEPVKMHRRSVTFCSDLRS